MGLLRFECTVGYTESASYAIEITEEKRQTQNAQLVQQLVTVLQAAYAEEAINLAVSLARGRTQNPIKISYIQVEQQ